MHYFDPSKSGQKFEWKQNDRPRVPEEAGYYDKGDKLKEERKKSTESKDLEDDGNRVPEDCTRKIASRKAT